MSKAICVKGLVVKVFKSKNPQDGVFPAIGHAIGYVTKVSGGNLVDLQCAESLEDIKAAKFSQKLTNIRFVERDERPERLPELWCTIAVI